MRVRMFAVRVFAAIVLMAAASFHARAQEDADGSKDHPMLSRFPGYYIEDYEEQDFSAYAFELPDGKVQKVEGRYWQISYWLKEGAKKGGPVQIGRNYSSLFVKQGGKTLYEDLDAGGGTLIARLPAGGKHIWLEVDISNEGEVYTLTVVEEAGMEQKVEFSAMELSRILNEKGSVALRGILFDTGQASIREESTGTLQSIGDLLKQEPSLRLEIQGHTDNVGTAAANRTLSAARAAAVKEYLVSNFGVAGDRLATNGLGDTRPVADNATEQGRAQNRRVELVRR